MNISDRSVRRLAQATPTDGRTDRTKTVLTDVSPLTAVDAGRAYDGMATLGETIEAGVFPDGTRHEVVRLGEREPIPTHVRSAVWYRDHGRCEMCPGNAPLPTVWELDHIVPWSAGGSDRTTNLRVLCREHNQARSNYVDPRERPRMAATWWCLNCHTEPWEEWYSGATGQRSALCPNHGWSRRCNVIRALEWIADNDAPDWWTREPIDERDALHVAYCAHCHAPALTDRPL